MAAACAAVAIGAGPQEARAIVVPTPPPAQAQPAATPTGTPNSTILPLNSSLFFVLDETITSREKSGTMARAHLRDPIVLDGKTIVPAGAPISIEVSETSGAQMANVNGFVEIYFEPLPLPGNKTLPLETPTSRIDPTMSAGKAETQSVTDTVGDIFIPGHFLYHMLRKGQDVTLHAGTVIRARTAASVSLSHGVVAISTPAPFVTTLDTPAPEFSISPVATPPGYRPSTPKPSPSPKPTATP